MIAEEEDEVVFEGANAGVVGGLSAMDLAQGSGDPTEGHFGAGEALKGTQGLPTSPGALKSPQPPLVYLQQKTAREESSSL